MYTFTIGKPGEESTVKRQEELLQEYGNLVRFAEEDSHWHKSVVIRVYLFEGYTLCDRERNGYDDSDFYCVNYDPRTGKLFSHQYATTRFWSYDCGCLVDATPSVIGLAEKALEESIYNGLVHSTEREHKEVQKGKRVKIVDGRKHKGKEGIVKWVGESNFRPVYSDWARQYRALIVQDDGSEFWVDRSYCEVIDPLVIDHDKLIEVAHVRSKDHGWHSSFVAPGYIAI